MIVGVTEMLALIALASRAELAGLLLLMLLSALVYLVQERVVRGMRAESPRRGRTP